MGFKMYANPTDHGDDFEENQQEVCHPRFPTQNVVCFHFADHLNDVKIDKIDECQPWPMFS